MAGLIAFFSKSLVDADRLELCLRSLDKRRKGPGESFRAFASIRGDGISATSGKAAHIGIAQNSGRGLSTPKIVGIDVIFDGSIYNRTALADELSDRGSVSPAKSDADLLAKRTKNGA